MFTAALFGQANVGELQLRITDPAGHPVRAAVHVVSDANQYHATVSTNDQGKLDLPRLPFGVYVINIAKPGFETVSEKITVTNAAPKEAAIRLEVATVKQTVNVKEADTLVDPEQAGAVTHVGPAEIEHRLTSIPGRSLQDLVNAQPGWLYEGNAVLHPRGSEYQTQFVVDGVPLTDNRSPSFGPELDINDVQSVSIYTAGIPAEYGRKMGGVVEVNTLQNAQQGFHGEFVASGGSFSSAGVAFNGEYTWGANTLGGSGTGSTTDHYLNPVVPENYSNSGTLNNFSGLYQRKLSPHDTLTLTTRHEASNYDIPNEQVQQAAGQRQTAANLETMGIASYQHVFSADMLAEARLMVRDNANDFNSNSQSTPIEVFQHNRFRETYFKSIFTAIHGRQEWKFGVESDNTFLHENFRYAITDPSQFDSGTPPAYAFQSSRPDLEQSAFVQDFLHLGNWTVAAGLRWDHYQLLVNKQAVEPRLAISRYFAPANLSLHFSYDRVFQTPSSQNILLSGSTSIETLSPSSFLRVPVRPSVGNYYEVGANKSFFGLLQFEANYFRRDVNNFADDDQIENTTISFPISFHNSVVYGAEARLAVADWHRWSGFLSYSYEVGNVWFPVTGGLFLGANASAAESQLTGHFPNTQDQRNTLRGRVRYQVTRRLWIAGGLQYDSGLPFEFDGNPATVLAEYGPQVLDRINFSRGRILPAFLASASAGVELHKTDRWNLQLQADGQNLNNVLDVLDFGGLFSGNAIGPSRSWMVRLTANF